MSSIVVPVGGLYLESYTIIGNPFKKELLWSLRVSTVSEHSQCDSFLRLRSFAATRTAPVKEACS